ncbi:hypothetical protein Taro_000720 [Colocasia esculenta]|uniref:Uncharacterized protein n=1 Tax=Colocasia esculenta TaxID=4460 RepID=A0A843TE06_COLES|nr:hypothetical protein [Colocasia esculenta]
MMIRSSSVDLDENNELSGELWVNQPNIDAESKETLAVECPRIVVNPVPTPLSLRGTEVPLGSLPGMTLDGPCVEDVDPKAWAVSYAPQVSMIPVLFDDNHELSKAEKFRLAFVERDLRLAPKRAKNVRQHQRRAEREWAMSSADAKII